MLLPRVEICNRRTDGVLLARVMLEAWAIFADRPFHTEFMRCMTVADHRGKDTTGSFDIAGLIETIPTTEGSAS